MSDLISRKETIRAIDSLGEDYISYYKLLMLIGRLPSAEPERKKGKLKTVGFLTCQCSECGAQFHELEYTNFCPNCGADMRGE